MFTAICPKLPMIDKAITKAYYIDQLGFTDIGAADFNGYLMLGYEAIEIHFFEHRTLDPKENYGQVYIRTDDIDGLYQQYLAQHVTIHPNGSLKTKPWGQREFSVLDPNNNLLTFGQKV